MGQLKNLNSPFDLFDQLLCVPPRVTVCTRENDLSSIMSDVAIFIDDNESPRLRIYEVRNMDESAARLFTKRLFSFSKPVVTVSKCLFQWKTS